MGGISVAVIGSSHCDRPTLLEYIRTAVTVLSLLTLDFKTDMLQWKGSWKGILLGLGRCEGLVLVIKIA